MTTRKGSKSDPAPLPGAGLGEVAYNAYRDAALGPSAKKWADLEHDVAAAWCAAALAALRATMERNN